MNIPAMFASPLPSPPIRHCLTPLFVARSKDKVLRSPQQFILGPRPADCAQVEAALDGCKKSAGRQTGFISASALLSLYKYASVAH